MSSNSLAVSVRNLSKSYTIAHNEVRHSTASEALIHGIKNFRKRSTKETFWALKDVSFDIEKGDIVGIIGRNGAGKSTLLKVLSQITEPTRGEIRLYGRVGSLLEVGTGFHPELTGRENIFLNGAILGMKKSEIAKQFDEIVNFAEVEKFLDTPVKRYSSGMYVRLAFAVAAHLNPEILIVDEVLAVGDATFQKKCLGKMSEVAQGGRTVIFVSHNISAVRALCTRAIFLSNGSLLMNGPVENIIESYLASGIKSDSELIWSPEEAPQSPEIRLLSARILNDRNQAVAIVDCSREFTVETEFEVIRPIEALRVGMALQTLDGISLCGSHSFVTSPAAPTQPGIYRTHCVFPAYTLNSGGYAVKLAADAQVGKKMLVETSFQLSFSVEDVKGHGLMNEALPGIIRPQLQWHSDEVVTQGASYSG